MQKRTLWFSVLLLLAVVSLVAVSTGYYMPVPYSTATYEQLSYSGFIQNEVSTYTIEVLNVYLTASQQQACYQYLDQGQIEVNCVPNGYATVTNTAVSLTTAESPYQVQATATVPYEVTSTSYGTILDSGTSAVLAMIILTMLGVGVALVLRHRFGTTTSQETVVQPKKIETETERAATSKKFCIECGSELPSSSEFCNRCGTKQP